jgi:hypothetical protein
MGLAERRSGIGVFLAADGISMGFSMHVGGTGAIGILCTTTANEKHRYGLRYELISVFISEKLDFISVSISE